MNKGHPAGGIILWATLDACLFLSRQTILLPKKKIITRKQSVYRSVENTVYKLFFEFVQFPMGFMVKTCSPRTVSAKSE